ncbi:ABC transporter permease [Uniformispora flossi]|uniref:ABC transporter permease n=1 Tax=Uniformispora flossi TaxID=3390723 RepID=UPI003C2C6291
MSTRFTTTTRFRGAVASECAKLVSVRSTYLTLALAFGLGITLGVTETSSIAAHWPTTTAAERAAFDPVGASLDGYEFGLLAFGVLGVLSVSGEYGTGQITATLTAVPRRGTVFAAKAAVVGGLSLALGELAAFTSFFLGQWRLSAAGLDVTLGDPGVLRAVVCAGIYLCVVAIVGFGLGAVVRHTAGAVAGLFILMYPAYAAARAFETWTYIPDHLLLANASTVLAQATAPADQPRVPSLGFALADLALYAAAALLLGAWRFRQD